MDIQPVASFATAAQRKEMLAPLVAGKIRTCFGVSVASASSLLTHCADCCYRTEPNTGLDTLKLKTLAKRDGDDYVISGQKM